MNADKGRNGDARIETAMDAMDRLAVELDGVTRSAAGGVIEYARGSVVFASQESARLSFRLRDEVVEAALKTPETARSARGSQWIVLAPAVEDSFTLDRAVAWFESAWRLAGESKPGSAALN